MPTAPQVPLSALGRPLESKYIFIDDHVYGRLEEKSQRKYFELILTQITKYLNLANYIAADAHRSIFDDEVVESCVTIVRYQYFEKLHQVRAWPDIKRYYLDPTARVPFPSLRPVFTHTARTRSPTPLQPSPTPSRRQEAGVPTSANRTKSMAPKSTAPKSNASKSNTSKSNASNKPRKQLKPSTDEIDDDHEPCPLPTCVLPTNRFAFQLEPVRDWSLQFMEWASKYAIDATKDRLCFGKSYMNKVSSMMSRVVKEGVWTSSIHSCKLVRPEYEAAFLQAAQRGRNQARAAGITRLSPAALAKALMSAKDIYDQRVDDGTLPIIELPKRQPSVHAKDLPTTPAKSPSKIPPRNKVNDAVASRAVPPTKSAPRAPKAAADDSDAYESSSHRPSSSTPPVTKARTRAMATHASSSKRKLDHNDDDDDNPQSSVTKRQPKKPRLPHTYARSFS
ncbi:hypothetical protein AURDEDRAFT_176392 [Auricularia subglabra TFB-10046 SS5]|uniref:Uncharacterized protein n=1 Tax=Auricularia subglabra (strain TFB-10046 / SS5) TaxID=717982 RepID=J0D6R2_AURST|nr:hypothetical protein AURDEDRAFT_176392 [Auricularia subglabra TFB-10046 SS5]